MAFSSLWKIRFRNGVASGQLLVQQDRANDDSETNQAGENQPDKLWHGIASFWQGCPSGNQGMG